jgi:hypothetical protein
MRSRFIGILGLALACAGPRVSARETTTTTTVPPPDPLERLQALGKAHHLDLPTPDSDEIPATASCTRATADEKQALQTRITAWLGKHFPAEANPAISQLRTGCVERGVLVADVVSSSDAANHALVLRVDPHTMGILHESDPDNPDVVLGLADLDGDAVRDPILARTNEDGRAGFAGRLSTLGTLAPLGGAGTYEVVGGLASIVLRLTDDDGATIHLRCVDLKGVHACADSARVHESEVADQLTAMSELPDRDTLAVMLAALHVGAHDAAPLLAAAPAVDPDDRITRDLAAFLHPDLTDGERAARAATDGEKVFFAPLRAALGRAACAPSQLQGARRARLGAWLAAHYREAVCSVSSCGWAPPSILSAREACAGPAGSYVTAVWQTRMDGGGMLTHETILFTSAAMTDLHVVTDQELPDPAVPIPAAFSLRGKSAVALIVETNNDGTMLSGFVDGARAGSEVGEFAIADHDGAYADTIAQRDGDGGLEYWTVDDRLHAVATVKEPELGDKPGSGVAGVLAAERLRVTAAAYLAGLGDETPASGGWEQVPDALGVLGAPAKLVGEVRARLKR